VSTGWKACATGFFSCFFFLHSIFLAFSLITLGGTAFPGGAWFPSE
jgi:hypothetical protein